ncbi:Uncharacterised protein [Bordetella pertussis]|nr:Uncharacterised protein [Bordetella pertussis]CFO74584.1 Uncharacterised protein [Bordetella pertussis]CFP60238.1 Uncharacterised protein [Bordetella pertussis]CFU08845.1 Uncharacterised protein [Bordetella pertussis]CFU82837.1 Uncharacterised protein [Bordetella pertussis]
MPASAGRFSKPMAGANAWPRISIQPHACAAWTAIMTGSMTLTKVKNRRPLRRMRPDRYGTMNEQG